jgi:diguanylate cyclase (GGDEF)-like protein
LTASALYYSQAARGERPLPEGAGLEPDREQKVTMKRKKKPSRKQPPAAEKRSAEKRDDGVPQSPARVGAYMTRSVITVAPTMPLREVCQQMIRQNISCVVVAEKGRPLGLISERAMVRRVGADRSTQVNARKAMSSPLQTCSPRTSLAAALEKMRENHIRRLVITRRGQLQGIITQSDLLEATNRQLAELSREHGQLRAAAMRDELTNLYNRRAFNEFFKEELERVRRYGGLLGLVLFDLDHFKAVNDHYGHDAGDVVLRDFARVLQDCSREVDIVARYGGEEFVVLMPAAGTRAARIYAERVRRVLAGRKIRAGKQRLSVTVSGGVCKFTRHAGSMRAMLKQADLAMYKAKHSGRNRVCVAQ